MNTPNPLIPQGALHKQSSGKSNLRIAVFTIAAIHLVFIGGLLMQGCKRDTSPPPAAEDNSIDRFTSSFPPYNPDAAPAMPADFPPPPPPPAAVEVRPGPPPIAPANNERAVLPPPVETARPESEGTEYIVVRGDSFWSIAQKHGVTVRAIEQANPNVNASRLQIGQKLQIPPASAGNGAQPAAANSAAALEDGIVMYTVRSGDSLSRIAQNHGTTLSRIRELNPDLRTDRILVGQQLRVPAAE
jgi:LysM repeat protein